VSETSEELDAQELVPDQSSSERRSRRPPIDVAPFSLDLAACSTPVDWRTIFGNGQPIELEVGSGKGLFLANAAAANPSCNYLGIEMARKYARYAAERVAKRNLANVKVLPGDATLFLARYVPPHSLRVVHVYFPDPWWKTRHRKRRVFSESLVLDIERGLEPNGQLRVATDVEEYFGVICELMSAHPVFEELPIPAPKTPEHELDYLTSFERKYRIEGRPIYRKHYRLR
jgi:tRNA (guanine-N7-)-methyltransferase